MPSTYSSTAYASTTQLNGVDKRTLTTTNPAASSVATKGIPTSSIGGTVQYYLKPETAIPIGAENVIPLNPVGTAQGTGWALIPANNAVVPLTGDGFTISAFNTATVVIRAQRDNNLTAANVITTFTAIFFRANSDATSFPAEIGRGQLVGATVTTTVTEFTVTVTTTNGETFSPGEIVWMEIHASGTSNSVVNSTVSYTTNINTGLRVTFGFTYTKQLVRPVSESIGSVGDTVARTYMGSRSLTDTLPVSDSVSRVFTGSRSISDTLPVSDSVSRVFTGARTLSDSVPVSDAVMRTFTGFRSITDNVPVADAITRAYMAPRALNDSLGTINDNITRLFVANRALSDALTPVSDSISRTFTGFRSITDNVPVGDSISRSVIYSRRLLDELATGVTAYPQGLLRLRSDGHIEAVDSNFGALPPGTLQLVALP